VACTLRSLRSLGGSAPSTVTLNYATKKIPVIGVILPLFALSTYTPLHAIGLAMFARRSVSVQRAYKRISARLTGPSVGLCVCVCVSVGKCRPTVAKRLSGSGCRLGWWVRSVEWWVGVLDGWWSSKGKGQFWGVNFGHPTVTNGDYDSYARATRSSQIILRTCCSITAEWIKPVCSTEATLDYLNCVIMEFIYLHKW